MQMKRMRFPTLGCPCCALVPQVPGLTPARGWAGPPAALLSLKGLSKFIALLHVVKTSTALTQATLSQYLLPLAG